MVIHGSKGYGQENVPSKTAITLDSSLEPLSEHFPRNHFEFDVKVQTQKPLPVETFTEVKFIKMLVPIEI